MENSNNQRDAYAVHERTGIEYRQQPPSRPPTPETASLNFSVRYLESFSRTINNASAQCPDYHPTFYNLTALDECTHDHGINEFNHRDMLETEDFEAVVPFQIKFLNFLLQTCGKLDERQMECLLEYIKQAAKMMEEDLEDRRLGIGGYTPPPEEESEETESLLSGSGFGEMHLEDNEEAFGNEADAVYEILMDMET